MMKQMNLLETPVNKAFRHYLVPAISATLVTSIYILADTMMIGRGVGALGMAALNILLPLFSLFFATGLLFGVGGGVLMSISIGKGEERQAKEYFTAALIGVTCFAVFYLIVCNVCFDPLTAFLGRNESMDAYVRGYGKILVSGAPIFAFSSFLQAFVRNDKAPKLAMTAVISGGVTNVVLDYLFIFVIPMGMEGGAIATVIGSVVTVTILCTHFFSKHNTLRLVPMKSIRQIGEVFINGLSSFIMDMSSGVIILLFNRQLLTYAGDLGVVVYGVVSNSALVVTSICNGIGQAAQPLLATNCGAGKQDRVLQTKHYGRENRSSGSCYVVRSWNGNAECSDNVICGAHRRNFIYGVDGGADLFPVIFGNGIQPALQCIFPVCHETCLCTDDLSVKRNHTEWDFCIFASYYNGGQWNLGDHGSNRSSDSAHLQNSGKENAAEWMKFLGKIGLMSRIYEQKTNM